jgi:GNAT acetyltransferase 2
MTWLQAVLACFSCAYETAVTCYYRATAATAVRSCSSATAASPTCAHLLHNSSACNHLPLSTDLYFTVLLTYTQQGLSGGRLVRVATHPDVQKMGYGTRAVNLLVQYFQGDLVDIAGDASDDAQQADNASGSSSSSGNDSSSDGDSDNDSEEDSKSKSKSSSSSSGKESGKDSVSAKQKLADERLKPRKKLPPLLVRYTLNYLLCTVILQLVHTTFTGMYDC